MDRELAFGALMLLICAPVTWIAAVLPGPDADDAVRISGLHLERRAWRSIWLRMLFPSVALAAVLGWALQEPEPAGESLSSALLLSVVPFAIVWARAAFRGARALASPPSGPIAATVGLVWPRVAVAREVMSNVDPLALRALFAHEEAHARHRDPLRIWLAQLASDLQWPWPAAHSRFSMWLHALELARDEEARLCGVDGADLAAAVVAVARLGAPRGASAHARLMGDGELLEGRVVRLLSPIPQAPSTSRLRCCLELAAMVSLLDAAFLLGVHYGEAAVRALPGVADTAHALAQIAHAMTT